MKITQFIIVMIILSSLSAGYAQSIDELLQKVVENNDQLKSIQLEYEAVLTKQDQVSQLPNPQLGVGAPVLRPETRLGPQIMMVSMSQMFPWFGTLKSKEEVVLSMSKAKYEQLAAVKLELFYQVKSAYYKLYFINQKEKVLAKKLSLFETLESLALAKVESGKATISDVLRIQAMQDEIKTEITKLGNIRLSLNAQINQAIGAPLEMEITIEDEISVNPIEISDARPKLEAHHPLVKQINYQMEVSQNRIEVNEKTNKPTIGIGLDYNLVAPRTDMNPDGNGRDILVPKVMFSVPIYRKKYNAVVKEEHLNQEALTYKQENLVDVLMSKLVVQQSNFDNALLEKKLKLEQIKKLQSAYEVILSEYSASGAKFEELITVQNELFRLELEGLMADLDAELATASMERIIGF